MSKLFSLPRVYKVTSGWLTYGAWQKEKQNKARARKRKKAQGVLMKLPTVKSQMKGEQVE